MKRIYQRSQILYFHELNEQQQAQATNQLDEQADSTTYVLWNDEPIPLSMFMRYDGKVWSGSYALSAFSGYLIRINKTGEWATVVYGHW